MTKVIGFPAPETVPVVTSGRSRRYRTPLGDLPSVTTILGVLGLSKGALIAWSAREERKAVLEAAAEVFAEGSHGDGPAEFAAAVEVRIGTAKEHQKQLAAAGEIGTAIHEAIRQYLNWLIDPKKPAANQIGLSDQALWGFMAFEDWWKGSGLTAVLTEQPVYRGIGEGFSNAFAYGGTIDLLARDSQGRLGIVDFKTGKGVYDEYHVQVAAYWKAAEQFDEIHWAKIVRLPKVIGDPAFEVKLLGDMYKGTLSLDELFTAFQGAMMVYNMLVDK